ncbi:MAG TPA: hypothetical protein DIT07_12535 [Sphingobacteriaceae bacterium]|nr:hypothetical protein [Sphingobacteriaceae bacterium]
METVKIIRVAQGKNTTLSHLYIHGIFNCYLLEDFIRDIKIPGTTCIPTGSFNLKLNNTAGMNSGYKIRYPDLHQGMVEISGIKTFDLVFVHIGNFNSDTDGCPLVGHYWNLVNGDYQMCLSAFAYQMIYPKLLKEIRSGNTEVLIINQLNA